MYYYASHSHSTHSACKVIFPLVNIIYPKIYCFIYLDLSVSGHLPEVSPIEVSKDKKRKYFNFSIQNDETLHWGVSFFPEKHRIFTDILKEGVNSGTEIKGFRSSVNNNDIIVNDLKQFFKKM